MILFAIIWAVLFGVALLTYQPMTKTTPLMSMLVTSPVAVFLTLGAHYTSVV